MILNRRFFQIIFFSLIVCIFSFIASAKYVVPSDIIVFDVWKYFEESGIESIEEKANALYFLTALQGIVNRTEPQLYFFASLSLFDVETNHYTDKDYQKKSITELDKFWFSYFQKQEYFKGRHIEFLKF